MAKFKPPMPGMNPFATPMPMGAGAGRPNPFAKPAPKKGKPVKKKTSKPTRKGKGK